MAGRCLRCTASAGRWRPGGTKFKFLLQILTDREIVPCRLEFRLVCDGVRIRYFSCPLFRRLFWAPALGRALQREICEFDVVHLHSVFLWPTWTAARAAKPARVPYVLSPRGMLIKDLISRRSRLVKSTWIHLIERSNIEHAAAVHLTSQLEAEELERFGWQLPRLAVIGNGIDDPLPTTGEIAADIQDDRRGTAACFIPRQAQLEERPRSASTRFRAHHVLQARHRGHRR